MYSSSELALSAEPTFSRKGTIIAIKTFSDGVSLPASDINTYLTNSGLVYVKQQSFSALTTWAMDNVFTSTYRNYKVIIDATGSSNSAVMRLTYLNSSGVEITAGYYGAAYWFDFATGGATGVNVTNGTSFLPLGYIPTSASPGFNASLDIGTPEVSTLAVNLQGNFSGVNSGVAFAGGFSAGTYNTAGIVRGFYLKSSAGTAMTGSVSVFGYRNG
jgi:hypothetical protein